MTTRKTERILNLTICLLVSGPRTCRRAGSARRSRATTTSATRRSSAPSSGTRTSCAALGVPIEVGSFDAVLRRRAGLPDLAGQEFELPPIELDADEASVVGVAARVWQHASMAESTR